MSTPDEDGDVRSRILEDLLAFSAEQSDSGRAFARHMQMRPTDATAIVEILRAEDDGRPLTPARLGERISMTSGATTILLNRLEAAGRITRMRGHADRRTVTLHSADHVHAEAEAFFEPERQRLLGRMDGFGDAELAVIRRFTGGLRTGADLRGHPAHPVGAQPLDPASAPPVRRTTGVRLSGQLVCATEDEAQRVREHLPEHLRLTRAEPGCLHFDVTQTEDPMIWSVAEGFENRDALTAHQDRVRRSVWGRATAGIERRYSVDDVDRWSAADRA